MIEAHIFQKLAEAEMCRSRSARSLCDLFSELSPPSQAAYGPTLQFIGCSTAITASEPPNKFTTEADRVGAFRLLLYSLSLDLCEPNWSSWIMQSLIGVVLSTPEGNIEDLLKATYGILGECNCPLTQLVGRFIKELILPILAGYRNHIGFDLKWLVYGNQSLTPAQAYFRFRTLSLRPELFTESIQDETKRLLSRSPFEDEVA